MKRRKNNITEQEAGKTREGKKCKTRGNKREAKEEKRRKEDRKITKESLEGKKFKEEEDRKVK